MAYMGTQHIFILLIKTVLKKKLLKYFVIGKSRSDREIVIIIQRILHVSCFNHVDEVHIFEMRKGIFRLSNLTKLTELWFSERK